MYEYKMTLSEKGSYNHSKIDIFIDKVRENTPRFIVHMSTNSSFSCRLNCNLRCLIVVIGNRTTPVVFGTHDNMVSRRLCDSPQTPEERQQTWGNL